MTQLLSGLKLRERKWKSSYKKLNIKVNKYQAVIITALGKLSSQMRLWTLNLITDQCSGSNDQSRQQGRLVQPAQQHECIGDERATPKWSCRCHQTQQLPGSGDINNLTSSTAGKYQCTGESNSVDFTADHDQLAAVVDNARQGHFAKSKSNARISRHRQA